MQAEVREAAERLKFLLDYAILPGTIGRFLLTTPTHLSCYSDLV